MDVRAGRDTRHADERDRLTAHDALPDVHERGGGMEVAGLEPATM